jgi:hypothetical protein
MNLPGISAVASVVGAGLVFSLLLLRLSIDIESPEILRYMLIGTIPLAAVLAFAITGLRITSARHTVAAALLLGALMCVPLESIAYLISVWGLIGHDAFDSNHLPILIAILIGWTIVVALVASLGAYAVKVVLSGRSSSAQ